MGINGLHVAPCHQDHQGAGIASILRPGCRSTGGAFGAKNTPRVTPVAAILSKKAGKPVKIVLTREEVLKATGPASGAVVTVKMGATKDGVLKAAQSRLVFGAGGFPGSPVSRHDDTVCRPHLCLCKHIERKMNFIE